MADDSLLSDWWMPVNQKHECLSVLIFGAAMVDYTFEVPETFLSKHKLEANANYNLSVFPELHQVINEAKEIHSDKIFKTPGGTVFNTARFFRWLEKNYEEKCSQETENICLSSFVNFIGVVGIDDDSDWLKQVSNQEDLSCFWVTNERGVTGQCSALICGTNRCLVSEGGANEYAEQKFLSPEVQSVLNLSDCVYTNAYLFLHESSFRSVLSIAQNFKQSSKLVFLNLASHKAFQNADFKKRVKHILHLCNYVIGNDAEFGALFEQPVELYSIEQTVLSFVERENITSKLITFVITKSDCDTIVARVECLYGDTKVIVDSFEVKKIPVDEIIDTTGAGDAFMAGFLYGISRKLTLPEIIKLAHSTASFCIKSIGASLTPLS